MICQLLSITFVFILLTSCTNNSETLKTDKHDVTPTDFYQNQMLMKNFQIENNGPCEDATQDTIHERSFAYIESTWSSESNTIVKFKFIESCCQEFLGDYTIENDTLLFEFQNVNDKYCSCLCWYKYKLTINEPKENFKSIVIREKWQK